MTMVEQKTLDTINRLIDVANSDMREAIQQLRNSDSPGRLMKEVYAAKMRRKELNDLIDELESDDGENGNT